MREAMVDFAGLVATSFGRHLYREIREMQTVAGTTAEDLVAHMRRAVTAENTRRANMGVPVVEVEGLTD